MSTLSFINDQLEAEGIRTGVTDDVIDIKSSIDGNADNVSAEDLGLATPQTTEEAPAEEVPPATETPPAEEAPASESPAEEAPAEAPGETEPGKTQVHNHHPITAETELIKDMFSSADKNGDGTLTSDELETFTKSLSSKELSEAEKAALKALSALVDLAEKAGDPELASLETIDKIAALDGDATTISKDEIKAFKKEVMKGMRAKEDNEDAEEVSEDEQSAEGVEINEHNTESNPSRTNPEFLRYRFYPNAA